MSDVEVTSEAIGGLWIALMFTVIILQDRRLRGDHARIVAEKDAEIQRLREALEGRRTNSGYDAALNPYQQKE